MSTPTIFTVVKYKQLVVVVATVVLMANLPVYMFESGILPIAPLYWLLGIGALAFPFVISDSSFDKHLAQPLPCWIALSCALASMGYLYSDQSAGAMQVLKDILLANLLMITLFLIFSWGASYRVIVLRTIAVCLVLTVPCIVWDLTHPFSFMPYGHPQALIGRGAAWFINPNQAGAALVIGMVLSISTLRNSLRAPFALFVLIGVLATFSRAALLAWIVSVFLLAKSGAIQRRFLIAGLLSIAFFSVLLFQFVMLGGLGEEGQRLNVAEGLSRVQWIADSTSTNDFSANMRMLVIQDAWRLFSMHPYFGNGLGSTMTWSHPVSTHNIYLANLADFGIIGIFIYPLLIAACIAKSIAGRDRSVTYAFAAAALLFGLFSHNVMTEFYYVLFFAVTAASQEGVVDKTHRRDYANVVAGQVV